MDYGDVSATVSVVDHGGVQFHGQETVNKGSITHVSDGGVDLPGQVTVNEDVETSENPRDGGVCQGKRNRTPREMYVLVMQGKTYTKGKYKGIGFPTERKRSAKGEEHRNQFVWGRIFHHAWDN